MAASLKRQLFLVLDLPRQHDRRRVWPMHASIWGRSVMSVRSVRRAYLLGSSAMLALLGLQRCGPRASQASRDRGHLRRGRNRSRARRRLRVRPRAPTVAPLTPAEQAPAKNNAFDQSRSNLYTTIGTTSSTQTHATIDALPQRHQPVGREGAAAGARRVAGFCGERLSSCPQRSCQCAVPHQRRYTAGRDRRLRQRFEHQLGRQHCARHRRAAGGVRPAHGRPGRHHDARRCFQQFGECRLLRRQPRHHHADLRIWRHLRRQLSDNVVVNRDEGAAIVLERKLFSRRPVLLHRPLSADHGRHRKSDADAQRHP